jgi:hypothetical protein
MPSPWERRRLAGQFHPPGNASVPAGQFLRTLSQLAGETPALPGKYA